ncbi:hypothetical protein D6764_01325 [Candidatus Woesearchaeota archaeon]|nr:MAG: hypothetical protein D6764_01325 [Candidatus Woesearchaeota archaeon]
MKGKTAIRQQKPSRAVSLSTKIIERAYGKKLAESYSQIASSMKEEQALEMCRELIKEVLGEQKAKEEIKSVFMKKKKGHTEAE